jgi:hypothetical protein
MITLKGKSYRLRERGIGVAPAAQASSLFRLAVTGDASRANSDKSP